jgi:hypothetical protein
MLEINLFLKNGGSLQVTTDKHSKEEILNLYHITKVGILQLELSDKETILLDTAELAGLVVKEKEGE